MPNRPSLPAPGTPMFPRGPTSLYNVLQPVFDMVGQSRQVDIGGPISGMVGAGGLQFTAPNPPIIKLFELTTDFTTNDLPSGSGCPVWPADMYYWAKGKVVNFFPYGSDRSTQQWHVYVKDNIEEYIFDPAGQSAGSSSSDDGSDPQQPQPPYGNGDRVWCISDPQSGFWVVMAAENGRIIGALGSPLSQGQSATVNIYTGPPGSESDSGKTITAWDWLMNVGDSDIPIGTHVICEKINGAWYVVDASCVTTSTPSSSYI